jgi:hypothetical protein
VRPYTIPSLNHLETFNEACIYLCTLPSMMFSDLGSGGLLEYQLGWAVIGVVTLNVIVNIIVLAGENIKGLRAQCRKRCKSKVAKKEVTSNK